MQTFSIAFLKDGTSMWSKLIRLWERGVYSHCELVFSDGCCGTALHPDGLILRRRAIDPAKWDVIELPAHLEKPAREWFESHKGKTYDYVGVLRLVLGIPKPSRDKWICTGACADALGMKDGGRFGPNGFYAKLNGWL